MLPLVLLHPAKQHGVMALCSNPVSSIQKPCALVQAINLRFRICRMGAILVAITKDPCEK